MREPRAPTRYHQAMNFQAGQRVGEYEIARVLGRGGLGAVYQATHTISRRPEALKIMLAEQTSTPEMAERFRREIQMLATLNHPNIAGLHNAFYFEDQMVMVMELVEGEDLRSRSRRMRMPLPQLIDYTAQVLLALEYAHSRGVVHRDGADGAPRQQHRTEQPARCHQGARLRHCDLGRQLGADVGGLADWLAHAHVARADSRRKGDATVGPILVGRVAL